MSLPNNFDILFSLRIIYFIEIRIRNIDHAFEIFSCIFNAPLLPFKYAYQLDCTQDSSQICY